MRRFSSLRVPICARTQRSTDSCLPWDGYPTGGHSILPFRELTVTRSTEGSAQSGPNNFSWIGANTIRWSNMSAGQNGYVFEGSRINSCLQSDGMSIGPWSGGDAEVTPGGAIGPDGTASADVVEMIAGGQSPAQAVAGAAANKPLSVWVKAHATADVGKSFRVAWGDKANATAYWAKIEGTLTASWVRHSAFPAAPSGGALANTNIRFDHRADNPESGVDLELPAVNIDACGWQTEISSYVGTYSRAATAAFTRSADIAGIATVNASVRTQRTLWNVVPWWANTDAGTHSIIRFNDSSTTEEGLYYDPATDKFSVAVGNAIVVASNALTFSANQALQILLDPAAGTITVSGATTGDGTVTGTAWVFSDLATRIGVRFTSSNQPWGGLIQEPTLA